MLGRMVRPVGSSAFSITSLAWSSLYLADYTSAPWAATASAGVSSTTGPLVTAGSDPTAGTAQGGKTPARFTSSSSQYLSNATAPTTLFSAGAGTIMALFYGEVLGTVAATGSVYDDAALYVDAGDAHLGLTYTTSGFTGYIADGATSRTVAAATGSYHLVMMRWNGSLLGVTVDSGAESTIAAGSATLGAGPMRVGQGYAGSKYIDGRLLAFGTAAVDLSASYTSIKSALNTTFALVL